MDPVVPWSSDLALEVTIQRLKATDRVKAVGFLGSTATEEWTEESDFDLCVLLEAYPPEMGVEGTIIDGRLADIVLIDAGWADRLAAGGSGDAEWSPPSDEAWPFVDWLAHVRPAYDPTGLCGRAGERARHLIIGRPSESPTWQRTTRSFLTQDLRVNQALLRRADDPVIHVALGMRQLHTFVAAVQSWFTARGIPQAGWKTDVGLLKDHDPSFFDLIDRWLGEPNLTIRHELFAEAVDVALAPIGGPLPEGTVLEGTADVWEYLGLADETTQQTRS